MSVKDRDVTEADDPFRVFAKPGEVKGIDDAAEAIAAAAAKDRVHAGVIQHLLQVRKPRLIAAGKIIRRVAAEGCARPDTVSPFRERLDTGLRFLDGHVAGGADNGNGIAGAKVWRNYQGRTVLAVSLSWTRAVVTVRVCGTPCFRA